LYTPTEEAIDKGVSNSNVAIAKGDNEGVLVIVLDCVDEDVEVDV
jgi:hypothetical protein